MSTKQEIMLVLQQTPQTEIAELEFVQKKFIDNYNACHKDQNGDLMYHRQQVYFKQQITATDQLKKCDQLSLYACFLTAAVKGYSFDPLDNEVYLIPRGGKAVMQLQAGAYVRRLKETDQIKDCNQAKLVYDGDILEVEDGIVKRHVECFKSEIIICAYVKFITYTGTEKYFIYRKSDWEAWKKKSPQASGDNWTGNNGQPMPAFLRTKVILHAAKDKCWATGLTPTGIEMFPGIETDIDEEDKTVEAEAEVTDTLNADAGTIASDNEAFKTEAQTATTIIHQDDEF